MDKDADDSQALKEMVACHLIRKMLAEYMRGLDRLIPELVRSVFHDDATTDYGSYKGGPDGFVAFAMGFLQTNLANHHMLGQTAVQVEGETAFGEIYFQAHHRLTDSGMEKDLFVGGRYVDRYERREGIWKIAHRTEVVDWVRQEDDCDVWNVPGAPIARGKRAPEDLSCRLAELRRR